VITAGGTSWAPVPNPSFAIPRATAIKIVWDVSTGAADPSKPNPAFDAPARVLNQAAAAGVSLDALKLAVVVHGNAGKDLLAHAAYRRLHGTDNPNLALLEALAREGVRVIICGQTIAGRNLPRAELLPFVEVSLSATWAFAVLQEQGYHVNPF
jgi:intracellular sulfur oxidation DsrE/DsrF family protein